MSDKKIMYDSDLAAVYEERTLKGWWSVKSTHNNFSRFFEEDEHMARYDGCTHMLCKECGKRTHRKSWTCCADCRAKHTRKRYEALQVVDWDGETYVCTFDDDQFFNSPDEIYDYCEEHGCKPEDLMLVLCEPGYPSQVNTDYWCDELPEDGELPAEVLEALDALNDVISKSGPIAWWPGKKRISFGFDETD